MIGLLLRLKIRLLESLVGPNHDQVSHLARAELSRALSEGCPVCVLEAEALQRFRFWFLNEYYGETAWIERLTTSVGFCRNHTWMLIESGAPYRLSYVALYLAEGLLAEGPGQWARPGQCPLCTQLAAMRRSWCRDLARLLAEEPFARRYRDSPGLCPAHLQMVVRSSRRAQRTFILPRLIPGELSQGDPP